MRKITRAKREKTLELLAVRLANKVTRTKKSVRLEPMNLTKERLFMQLFKTILGLQPEVKVKIHTEGL